MCCVTTTAFVASVGVGSLFAAVRVTVFEFGVLIKEIAMLITANSLTPHVLLDYLRRTYDLKNDSLLAKALGVLPPQISKIRNKRSEVTPTMILAIHDAFGMEIKEIKALAAESRG
jgi:transcriptional regulator with XRE-family HTH domain